MGNRRLKKLIQRGMRGDAICTRCINFLSLLFPARVDIHKEAEMPIE